MQLFMLVQCTHMRAEPCALQVDTQARGAEGRYGRFGSHLFLYGTYVFGHSQRTQKRRRAFCLLIIFLHKSSKPETLKSGIQLLLLVSLYANCLILALA